VKRNTLITLSAVLFALGVWAAMKEPVSSPYASRPYDNPNAFPIIFFLFALVVGYKAFKAKS
jgi:hypothetical protein